MKHLLMTLTLMTSLVATNALAENDNEMHNHDHKAVAESGADLFSNVAAKDKVTVRVNGLVCDFCARALEKVFSKRDEVAGIKVDLDAGEVLVAMKDGQTIDDATLTALITDSGYNVTAIERGK